MGTTHTNNPSADVWDALMEKLALNDPTGVGKWRLKQAKPGWDSQNLLKVCKDGERTAHLTGLAGSYLHNGFDINQTIEHCLLWNSRNTPPLDVNKVIATCQSIAARDAINHPERSLAGSFALLNTPATLPTPWFDLADARIGHYLNTAPPVMRWVLDGFLPLGIVAAVVAQGGAGKSQWLMQLCYSVSTGIPLAGHWSVGEPGTVLMLCAEDSSEDIHRRVHRIHHQVGKGMSTSQLDALQKNFLIRSVAGLDVQLTQLNGKNEVLRTGLTEQLLLTAQQADNLKLIIIDPASRFRGGDENSNAHATRFVQTLEYLVKNTGATVLIAHHTGKGAINSKETNQDASRGASALTDGIRWQFALTPMTNTIKGNKELPPNARHRYLQAKLVKSNYTELPPEVLLLKGPDGYLEVTTSTGTTAPNFVQEMLSLLGVLRTVQAVPGGITARQLETQHGGITKALKMSEKAVRDVITLARARGYLQGDGRKPLQLTDAAVEFLQKHAASGVDAAPNSPRGTAGRRKKP